MPPDQEQPVTMVPMWSYMIGQHESVPLTSEQMMDALMRGGLHPTSLVRLHPSAWLTLSAATRTPPWHGGLINSQDVTAPPPACFVWSYLDSRGNEQGPYNTLSMKQWIEQMWIYPSTLVRLWPHGWLPMNLYIHGMQSVVSDDYQDVESCSSLSSSLKKILP